MRVYVVERYLPGITMTQLSAVRREARETSTRFVSDGQSVHYRGSIFLPSDSRCLCLFDGSDARLVGDVNDVAHLVYTRMLNAIDLITQP